MAYALATRLLRAVKASGLPHTQVAGWQSRGRGTMGRIQTVTLHHTATPRSYMKSNDIPTLNVLKNGHGSLPGPLCQIGLGRSGHVYLVAAGVANHAGRSRATSMTNSHAVGIEAEGAMEAWPAAQYRAYVLLVAALLTEFGLANGRALRHAETCSPPGRKIDASFPGPPFRREVANVKPGTTTPPPTPEEEIMARIGSGTRLTNITLTPGQKRRIPANESGVIRMCNVKKNQLVDGLINLNVTGLLAGESLGVNVCLALYDSKAKKTTIKSRFAAADIPGKGDGKRVQGQYAFKGKSGHGSSGTTAATLQVEVHNPTDHEVTVTYLKYEVWGN